jgi:hypothetical protein
MTIMRQVRTPETAAPRGLPVIRLVFAATVCFGIWQCAGVAVAAGVRDCIAFEESEAEDAITYRNDCNRTILFYYCVIDPQRSEVAPCRRVITGTRKVVVQGSKGHAFLVKEMDPRSSYDIKLWGGTRIKWAACDAELGGLESFQPKGNAALDFSYECNE